MAVRGGGEVWTGLTGFTGLGGLGGWLGAGQRGALEVFQQSATSVQRTVVAGYWLLDTEPLPTRQRGKEWRQVR